MSIAGVTPTEATISDLSYPGSRKLFVYIKGEHMAAKPSIKQFVEAYAKGMGAGGMLAKRGLVPWAPPTAAATAQSARQPLDP